MKIKGQAALVTGGGSGLGAAVGEALAKAGARVTLLDRSAETVAATAARLGCGHAACDVADEASTAAAIEQAERLQGIARIVVNCAGIATPGKVLGRNGPLPLSEFSRVIQVNLIGSFNVIRLAAARLQAAPTLEDGERGVVINTASIAAFEGQVGQPAYAASKAGVVGMTLPLAREFARIGVRVVTIAPGVFETPMVAGALSAEQTQALTAGIPFPPRMGRPAEFAGMVMAIVENPYLNGETIRLDAAHRMQGR